MSRVERHAAEEAAKHGKRYKEPQADVTTAAAGATEIQADPVKSEPAATGKKKKPPMTFMGKLLNLIGTLIMLSAVVVSLGLSVPRFFGIESFIVVSGSMEPAIPVGSMVFSKAVEPATLQPGDVIIFNNIRLNDTPITHRVVENHTDQWEIITKGDANDQNDIRPVTYDQVRGKVIRHIPQLGYIASPLSTLMGKIAIGMILVAGFLLTEVGVRLRKKPKY